MRVFWVIGALAAVQAAGAQVDEPTFDWNGSLPAGATLHIVDVDGNIRVTGTSAGTVRVHGERTHVISGDRALVFEVVKSGDDVIICARYPNGRCDARGAHGDDEFHIGIGGHSPTADFTVELPAGIKLAAKSGDGSISVSGVDGDVQANSGDGEITVENAKRAVTAHTGDGPIAITAATGPIDASSGDGDIQVHLAKGANPGEVRLHTGDGSVTVFVGSQFGGELDASTGDGHIESDMPLAVSGRMDPRHIYATLGSGGDARLNIRTGDGDIRIKRE